MSRRDDSDGRKIFVGGLPFDAGDAEIREDGALAITYRYGEQSVAEMIEKFRASGARIDDLRTEEADLEDVFLALTYRRESA